ncbi:MAG: TonB-dependent receptor, partial [Spirochaetota bacterium]|nr:TonB-dependent receptor [Spirochaetota bacterium]
MKSSMLRVSLTVTLCLILCLGIWAEEAEKEKKIKLEDVVVTATRTEKNVDNAPGSVSVITEEDMKKLNFHTLDEALKYESGTNVLHKKGLADSMPSIQLRGLYGAYRTLVLLDGIPLNQGYTGDIEWNSISTENIKRIEIIRGPASALYGGNAMGGVINIITSTPKKLEAKAKFGYGSDSTIRYSAYVGDKFMDTLSLSLGFEHEETEGYPTKLITRSISDGTGELTGGYETTDTSGTPKWVVGDQGDNHARRWNLNLKTKYDLTDTGYLAFNFQTGFHRYEYGEPHTYLRDENGDPAFSGYVDLGNGQRASASPGNYVYYAGDGEKKQQMYSLAYREILGSVTLNARAGYQKRDSWYTSCGYGSSNTFYDAPGSLSDGKSYSAFSDLQADIPIGDTHLLTSGLYSRYDSYEGDNYDLAFYRDKDSKIEKTVMTEGKDRFHAAYLQDEWQVIDRLTLFIGARLDYWKAFDGKSGNIGDEQKLKEPEDHAISPKLAVILKPNPDTVIKGSAGRAFRAPTIGDLYKTWTGTHGTYYSNPDLDPETLWNYEFSADQYLFKRMIKLSATYFHTDIYDLIYSYKGEDGNTYYDNAAEARIDGVELG